jgi:hypothetical protein
VIDVKKEFDSYKEVDNENIYEEGARDSLVENDQISASEAGFMQGWDEAG